jgi:DNA-binding transcriptional ArsR family regulator
MTPLMPTPLAPAVLEQIARRFRALGETSRLMILSALLDGERSVTELIDETGLGQANVSKHLRMLHDHGFVERRKDGLNVLYRLTDEEVFMICEIMCGRLEREARAWEGALRSRDGVPARRSRSTGHER